MIPVAVPSLIVVIYGYCVLDAVFAHIVADVLENALMAELRRVHPDDDQAAVLELVVPAFDVGLHVLAVVAAEGPKFDEKNLAFKFRQMQGLRIYPRIVSEFRRGLSRRVPFGLAQAKRRYRKYQSGHQIESRVTLQ